MRLAIPTALVLAIFLSFSCARETTYKENVERSLEQANLSDISVDENRDQNLITLKGMVASEDDKQRAEQVAKGAAGPRMIANEISVEGQTEARSNLDEAIESNYRAALISKGLDKQEIEFDVNNGVVTLKGRVDTQRQREEAQQLASNIPDVEQVINQIEVRR